MPAKGSTKYREGDTVIAPNGYKYIYVDKDDKLTRVFYHHWLAYKKYGRWPREDERVVFRDGDRRNLTQSNVEYRIKNHGRERTLVSRQKAILNRIQELQAEYAENTEELKKIREEADG